MGILLGLFSILFQVAIIIVIVKAIVGTKKRHYRWLQKELLVWEGQNLISRVQGDSILGIYRLARLSGEKKKLDMAKAVTLIGAGFVGLGIIFFIASNWQKIPPDFRTILVLGITLATLGMGYIFSFEKKGFSSLGTSLVFLSSLMWGGSVALIGQIYHIPVSENWYIVLLWVLPIIPVALFLNNRPVYILSSILLLVWNFMYSAETSLPNYVYPIIVFTVMLPAVRGFSAGRWVNCGALLITALSCISRDAGFDWLSLVIASGFIIYFLYRQTERVYLYAATFSFIVWAGAFYSSHNTWPNIYFLLPLSGIMYVTYTYRSKINLALCLLGLVIWQNLLLCSFSAMAHSEIDEAAFFIFQSLLGIILYIAGIMSEKKFSFFEGIYKIAGIAMIALATYVVTFQGVLDDVFKERNIVYLFASVFAAGIITAYLIDAVRSRALNKRTVVLECAGFLVVMVGGLFIMAYPSWISLNTVVANAVFCMCALLIVFFGVETQKPAVFNFGISVFVLFIITRYLDVMWKLREKSLFFIIGGLILLGAGAFFEKQRRKVIERMKNNAG